MRKIKSKLIEYACEIMSLHSLIHKLQRTICDDDLQIADCRRAIRTLRETKHDLLNQIADLKQQVEVRDKQIEFIKNTEALLSEN